MKAVLFCTASYDFAILKPLADALEEQGDKYLWYILPSLFKTFPYKTMMHTNSLELVEEFQAEAIFTPSSDLPYWLKGLKVHLFHGLSRENKTYFELSDSFDLYLTPGPFITKYFEELAKKGANFKVVETGWSKLDRLFTVNKETQAKREQILAKYKAKHILLYAPTFSPSLSSADKLYETIQKLGNKKEIVVMIKFHEKMSLDTIERYQKLEEPNIFIIEESDIIPYMQIADLMISDTSSVVYEFLLLGKPLITFNSQAEQITWSNHTEPQEIYLKVIRTFQQNKYIPNRQQEKTIANYHPYRDEASSLRMIEAVKAYIKEYGIPKERKLSLIQKWKIYRKYNKLR